MKRLRSTTRLAILLSVVVAALSVGSAAMANPVTIWSAQSQEWTDALGYALEPFLEQNPDIEIELEVGGLYDPLIVAVAGGVGPDIFLGASLTDTAYGVQGLQVDLTPYLERDGILEEIRQDVFPGVLDGSVFKGKIYGIPFSTQIIMPFYNAHNFQNMGVAEPREGWTWPEMRDSLPSLRRMSPNGDIEIDAMLSRLAGHTAKFFLRMVGGNIWNPQTYEFEGSTERFRQAFEAAEDLSQRGLLRTYGIEINEHVPRFVSGNASFYLDGNFRLGTIEQDPAAAEFVRAAPTIRYAEGMTPRYDSSHRSIALATPADGEGVSDDVWKVFKYLISTEGMARLTSALDFLPPRQSVINHPHYLNYLETTSETFRYIATQIAPYSYAPGATGMPEGQLVYSQFNGLVQRYLKGEIGFAAMIEEHEMVSREPLASVRALLAE